jgi:hypothetical protein
MAKHTAMALGQTKKIKVPEKSFSKVLIEEKKSGVGGPGRGQ